MVRFTKILPLLIIVSILSFSVRLSDVVVGVSNLSATAYAKAEEEKKEAKSDQGDKKEKKQEKTLGKGHMKDMSEKNITEVKGDEAKAPK